ncbi:FAD-dependent oxidoreductase [Actinospica sp. MGRD01-02]|uniref:FAD-dependent oxidoreductase n=1 Tax=Actinospica acidithermotolerans TaxID=2828514 RepID=A0A941E5N8_9ACTN|nr:FAD-binding oxidoreductase [Actinospica acidithermotolerans]MBR7824882.1 FAD-dependent oxidoreductase [Actinospica acidithermotolerans]
MTGPSFWHDSLPQPVTPRPPLPGDSEADVVIVGAGYTGLWTAYYLKKADPGCRVIVLESEYAGFGASGRNGGWCSALFPSSLSKVAKVAGSRDAAIALQRTLNETVDEVGAVTKAEGIDCHYAKGGTIILARTPVQLERAQEEIAEFREYGFGEEDHRLLTAEEAKAELAATDVLGATYTPHCAAIQPALLARGLADVVERMGVQIYEQTPATSIWNGEARTPHGNVRAETVVRATEGYTKTISGFKRAIAPVYSLMLATEPLTDAQWDEIGLKGRQTFSDGRHLIIYGQRTADGRFAFGGRGAPYHYGSSIKPEYDSHPRVHTELKRVLDEMFPVLRDVQVSRTWGGALGVPRDWFASVGYDRAAKLAWAGGYVGDGVGAANLAGRTLADLIRGKRTPLTALPWVGHQSPKWEFEPFRWIGANLGLRVMDGADAEESRTGRASRRAALFGRFLGS